MEFSAGRPRTPASEDKDKTLRGRVRVRGRGRVRGWVRGWVRVGFG